MQTAIQFHKFPQGGFVLHSITVAGRTGRFSAWYDAAGDLLDAEQIRNSDRTHAVKRGAQVWQDLAYYGRAYKNKTA